MPTDGTGRGGGAPPPEMFRRRETGRLASLPLKKEDGYRCHFRKRNGSGKLWPVPS